MTVRNRPLVVGNWKMNHGERVASELVTALRDAWPFDRVDAVVAPAFPCLRAALDAARGSALAVGAQNLHTDDRGAFTGEVAAPMLAEMGVQYAIVGHSERRALFGETDAIVARKVAAASRHGIAPILCVGETEAERHAGLMTRVVDSQIRAALESASPLGKLVVAYEPVWAIGTGRTPVPADVSAAHAAIRGALHVCLGEQGDHVRIVYGGSANPGNVRALLTAPGVDGALVGGASLDAASFLAIAAVAG